MEDDSPRTLAALVAEGFTHLEARCPDCERCTQFPLRAMAWPGTWTLGQMAAKLVCARCGARPPALSGYDTAGPSTPPDAFSTWGLVPGCGLDIPPPRAAASVWVGKRGASRRKTR